MSTRSVPTVASIPRPGKASKLVAAVSGSCRDFGRSDDRCAQEGVLIPVRPMLPVQARLRRTSEPSGMTSVTSGRPVVMVPVLSNTTVVIA